MKPSILAAALAATAALSNPALATGDFLKCMQGLGPDELKTAGDAAAAVASLVDDPACAAQTSNPVYLGLAGSIAALSIAANASGDPTLLAVFADSQSCSNAPENAALAITKALINFVPGLSSNTDLVNALNAGDSAAVSALLKPALDPFLIPYNCACKFADLTKDAKKLLDDGLKTVDDAKACGAVLGDVANSIGNDVQQLGGPELVPGVQQSTSAYYCPSNECDPITRKQGNIANACDCPPPRTLINGYCRCESGTFTGFKASAARGTCNSSDGASPDFAIASYQGGSCTPCPPNTILDRGMNECAPLDCPAGQTPGATLGSCKRTCKLAEWFDRASNTCKSCDYKSIPDPVSGTSCQACPSGTFVASPFTMEYANIPPKCVKINDCGPGKVHQNGYPGRCIACDDGMVPSGLFTCAFTAAGGKKARWFAACLKAGMIADARPGYEGKCVKCPGKSRGVDDGGFPGLCESIKNDPAPYHPKTKNPNGGPHIY